MAGGCKSFVIADKELVDAQTLKWVRQIGDFAPAAADETLIKSLSKMGPVFDLLIHEDIEAKLTAARSMKKIRQRMPNFLTKVRESDAERVRHALRVAREEELDHPNDEAYQELVELLEYVVDGGTEVFRRRLSPKNEPKEAPAAVPYGQVVLQVKQQMDDRAALLNQILLLDGVVSVTFEDGYVIVATRSVATADPTFLSKLMSALGEQGLVGELFSVGEATGGGMGAPNAHPFASASAAGSSSTSSTGIPTEADREDENQAQAEPTYLDDELNDGFDGNQSAGYPSGAPGGGAGVPQWTFFSQKNWMMERRLQEYEDDPNVAARLANKKKQQQKKQKEDAKKFRWLTSWIGLNAQE